MCRLFAMLAEPCRVTASCCLLDAPDSLRAQSRAMPDGTGMGWFDEPIFAYLTATTRAAGDVTAEITAAGDSPRRRTAHVRAEPPADRRVYLADMGISPPSTTDTAYGVRLRRYSTRGTGATARST